MELTPKATSTPMRNRKNIAIGLLGFEQCLKNIDSQRTAAKKIGVPRETLRYWKDRKNNIPLPQSVIDCFESPEGTEFLHCLVTALQFVMVEVGGCGFRLVTQVLELSNLNHFVASSFETLRLSGIAMEEHVVAFGEEERSRLSVNMPNKKISIAEDETFHPQTCLVAIDLVSNFILLEKYTEKRDASSWNEAMNIALQGLSVEVIQSASDEAKGIINHVEKNLGAHHSPDIFHVQHEITKATSAALAAKERHAQKSLERATEGITRHQASQSLASSAKVRGRKPTVLKMPLDALESDKQTAKSLSEKATEQRQQVLAAKKSIGVDYHPYDLSNGQAKTPELQLNASIDIIEQLAVSANLKEVAQKKIAKAKRVFPALLQTLTFFWTMIAATLKSLSLSQDIEVLMRDKIIPAEYLYMASQKSQKSEDRQAIYEVATELMDRLEKIPEWLALEESKKSELREAAKKCAQYFQRSSSCVEGRNGYLSLRHHGLHHIGSRKLGTLTVIHNYFIERDDGTTAAERFFENKPRKLFEYLLEKMPYPGRSGKRSKLLKMAA
jgi:hypothetical protein